jgi:hypothetical protein
MCPPDPPFFPSRRSGDTRLDKSAAAQEIMWAALF